MVKKGINSKKGIKYGHWYPCIPGGMPEDLLEIKDLGGGLESTETVLIHYFWGNEHGGGDYYPVQRIRQKGHVRWEWYNVKTAKPLFWMPIPFIPTQAGVVVYKRNKGEIL